AIVRIRDGSGGFGRYHLRFTWAMTGSDYRRSPGGFDPGPGRRDDGFGRPGPGGGFSWNNAINFRGNGRGEAWMNGFGPLPLGEVDISIDRFGKMGAWFRTQRGRPVSFSGNVVAREGDRWKADVMSEDRRYRGSLYFTADERGNVYTVSLDASDGRDHMQ